MNNELKTDAHLLQTTVIDSTGREPKSQVIHGDFRDFEIPKGLTITDPPYNQGYAYNEYKDRLNVVNCFQNCILAYNSQQKY